MCMTWHWVSNLPNGIVVGVAKTQARAPVSCEGKNTLVNCCIFVVNLCQPVGFFLCACEPASLKPVGYSLLAFPVCCAIYQTFSGFNL